MPSLMPQWRSLEELAADPAFIECVAAEFPGLADALAQPSDRRRVLKLMGAAMAMSGLAGCNVGAPGGTLIPAVRVPPGIIPGFPNYYSTAHVLSGYADGIVVKHHMGRPIKVEGNPNHPASLGATDAFAQAQLMDFYDPYRAATITTSGLPSDWQSLLTAFSLQRARLAERRGAGLRILTGTVTSRTLAAQLDGVLATYPQARWHHWEPISRSNLWKGADLAYGTIVEAVPKLDAVDVLLAIDGDLISSAPGHLRFARELASRRNPVRTPRMSRIYAVEPTPTLIGSVADHRFIAGPRELHTIITALRAVILENATVSEPDWLGKVGADLKASERRALIHVGPHQPAEIHALVHAMNERLGARGATLELMTSPVHSPADQAASLSELVEDMRAGSVSTLLMIGCNPSYSAPSALGFNEALKRVDFTLVADTVRSETSAQALWFVPVRHPWEDWSDARAFDGTATILQPQALPIYGAASVHQVLALLTGAAPPTPLELVQATWRRQMGGRFEEAWREALAGGIVQGTASPAVDAALRSGAASLSPPAPSDQPLTVLFRPDPHLWDGRFANNPWLEELPRPLTKLTWDNPLLISPQTADRLKLQNGDLARLAISEAGAVAAPVWVMPGQAPDCVVALLGFGRQHAGPVGRGAGTDFYPIAGAPGEPTLEKTPGRAALASTVHHNLLNLDDVSHIVRHGTLADYMKDRRFLASTGEPTQLYRWRPKGPAAWAMSIDLNACIGCNACVVACQAENNTPVVGKDEVIRGREMHWLRIDRYLEGHPDAPESYFQPMLCMHCEQAPCEVVCPVGATVHDAEGLNVMVYNRCIGTRFCSNNCPYKVRRFNYFDFARRETRPIEARNPNVTVRARGVMEKCTFCIQRIGEARIAADRSNHPVGDVVTACQAACPTQALTFGNLAGADSEVVRRKQSPLDYALLEDQNTHPRVSYEAVIRNPHPAISGSGT
jgi:molybdopterin-containing oxidoreductase family iron-sulfur binding subunit